MLVNIVNKSAFFSVLDVLPIAIVVADMEDGKIVLFNQEAQLIWKRDASEVLGKPQTVLHSEYWNDKARETFSQDVQTLLSGRVVKNTRNALLRSDGVEIAIEIRANMATFEGKNYIVGVFLPIQDRVDAYNLLAKKEKEVRTIFENAQVGIAYLKNGPQIEKANQRLAEILGYDSPDELEGVSSSILHPSRHTYEMFVAKYYKDLQSHKNVQLEYEMLKRNGEKIWVALNGKALDEATPANLKNGMIWIVDDVTQRHKMLNELQKQTALLDFQAHHDDLTGLPNRTLYRDRIESAIQQAKRSEKKFALLFLDLDHFKEINDSLGHDAGDMLLLEVANRLKASLRAEDTLARIGGDEFTILMQEVHSIGDITTLAYKILDDFKASFVVKGHEIYISCSIGISVYPENGMSAEDLLKNADNAMYRVKDKGRGTFAYYTKEMTEMAYERMTLESNIRKALSNSEFEVYYQPQYNAVTQKMIGMEALVRWIDPKKGMISPAKFIPFAESSNLIIEIDDWVMQRAMRDVKQWREQGLEVGILSLNLSIRALESENFLTKVQETMASVGFEPEWLKLEILERDIMTKPLQNNETLQQLRALGISIAIDDFGTGQSSLTYLNIFPLDMLKIDTSFVRGIAQGETTILLAIISLARALGLDVIAEGVETQEELDFLLKHDCYNIQGYYFSRPVASKECEKLLQNSAKVVN